MSSCPPIRCCSGRVSSAALLVLVALLALMGAPSAVAQPALVAVPGGAVDGQTRVVVQAPHGLGPVRPEAFSVSVDGVAQPVRAQPVLSDRLALGLVVDASSDPRELPAGLSGLANLVLAAPVSARSSLVVDGTPPTVAVPWPSRPADTLAGLTTVRPGGDRRTADALDLAVGQLRADPTDPRLVVLYTGEPDAGGEPASEIIDRMRSAGVLLAVVDTAGGGSAASEFWTTAATGTGGVAVGAAPGKVIGAFDQVASALGERYLLTFPAPTRLPATAALRLETGNGALTSEIAVPAAPAGRSPGPLLAVAFGLAALVAVAALVTALLRWRRAGRDGGSSAASEQRRRSVPAAPVWNVPTPPEGTVERTALLAELAATLHVGGPVWLRPDRGAAGLGTTTVMLDFAHRHRARYDVAWWIPALDQDLVPDRLAELAVALGLAAGTDPADRATDALLEALPRRNRWLLVFDDAGSPHELARYLPKGPGDVLIASSDPEWRELASPVTVPTFARAESVSLLRSGRPDLTPEAADRIAAGVHDLPLAVGPVSALLADTGMDVDAACALLIDRAGPADADDSGGVDAVWAALLDRLAADDPHACALLTLVAWLGPAPVPLSLVGDNPDPLPEQLGTMARRPGELVEHAALLSRRGLARVTSKDLLLHPVPAALLVARTGQEHPDDGGWTAISVRLLRAAVPDRPAADPVGWPVWRRLLPHVLAVTDPARRLDVVADEVGWLLAQAGGYLQARGRSQAARALLEDANEFDVGARLRAFGGPEPEPTRADTGSTSDSAAKDS
jgi:hypothetical protein